MIDLFSTCPPSTGVPGEAYIERVIDVARWSEAAGHKGMLVYSDNSLVDPWLLSHVVVQHTTALCPLVAVQPVYMHPYWVAKQVASIAHLYRRRLYLNMVAGGFINDLEALNDTTPHDKRYARLIEYATIVMRLLSTPAPLTYIGAFYSVLKLKLTPPIHEGLVPGVFVSGSSDVGSAAARMLGAIGVTYPKPADQEQFPPDDLGNAGIRVGIVARETDEEAWVVAQERFPEESQGQPAHQLATKVSESPRHTELSDLEDRSAERNPYWLVPFHSYNTMCPYLVGSYDRVARELARYIALGCGTFILDVPYSQEELRHTGVSFERAISAVNA